MISALSVSDSGNQVFRVPMWDAYAQRSATGGYPWRIEGNSSTMVYIKNTEEQQQHYYLQLKYPDGIYSLGVRSIEAGQTVSYDLRKLRDLQVPDAQGRVIPLDASSGQVHWSKTGNETGMLIGRSEQVDTVMGISSSYACVNCCPDNAVNARLVPDSASAAVSASSQFVAEYQLTTCYGAYSDWLTQYDADWSSNNESVASVSVGLAQANAPGTATIKAEWYADHYHFVSDDPPGAGGIEPIGGTGSCELSNLRDHLSATATFTVVQCATPSGESTSGVGWDTLDPTLHNYEQTLAPSGTSFVGRTVTEQDPGGGGPDTCHFTDAAWDPYDKVTGGTWTVITGNKWHNDSVGYHSGAVSYYRNNGRAPCGTTYQQKMVISCSSGPILYVTNTLSAEITGTTVSSTRAGDTAIKTWP